jgi:hypothetical protein
MMNSGFPGDELKQPLSSLASVSPQAPALGSLAQSSRRKQLAQARGILIVVGVLYVLFHGIFFANSRNEVNEVIKEEISKVQRQPGMMVNPIAVEEQTNRLVTIARIIYGSLIALGIIFIIFGLIIHTYPVAISITSLVLFIGVNAILGYLNPVNIVSGIILKVIVIVVLIKSIQSAIAYQSEQNSAEASLPA